MSFTETNDNEACTAHHGTTTASRRSILSMLENTPSQRIVTTSWDDGDPRDIKVAELLRSRGLGGTFYVPITGYLGGRTLAPSDLRALSAEGFEIGAHGVSHRSLSNLSSDALKHEVTNCKQTLEQILGKEVVVFCYPNGRYNARVVRYLQRAGYQGARNTRMLSVEAHFPLFEMPTTVHAYPHRRMAYVRNLGRARSVAGLFQYATKLSGFDSWIELGKQLFAEVLERGGVWHLYGHSWEIDQLGIWPDLEQILDHVSRREGVIYISNGQLLSRAWARDHVTVE